MFKTIQIIIDGTDLTSGLTGSWDIQILVDGVPSCGSGLDGNLADVLAAVKETALETGLLESENGDEG